MPANRRNTERQTVQVDLDSLPALTDEQKARLQALAQLPDKQIDYSDAPFLPAATWVKAVKHSGRSKKQISLRLDADVLDFFKNSGKRYQTHINAVLRSYMDAQGSQATGSL